MSTPIIQSPRGTMNSDADYQLINGGDYPFGHNIRFDTNLGESQWAAETIIGNLYAARLGEVVAQDKLYRVYLNTSSASNIWELTFYDQNNVELFSISADAATYPTAALLFAQLNTLFTAGVPADWSGVFSYTTTSVNEGYVDIVLSRLPYNGHNFSLTAVNTFDDSNADKDIIAEAIDQSMTGYYRAIGSFDLLGELFVWATTGIHMPTDVTVLSIANNGFGEIRVTTQNPHLLVSGDSGGSVTISGTGSAADGTWLFAYVSGTTLDLIGSVYAAPLVTTGNMVVWGNAYGAIASVIAYDAALDSWTLKKLIRTREFNFRLLKQPDTLVIKDLEKYSFYWTDNYNPPRVMYYYGTFIDDGAIDALNPETNPGDNGIYEYGSIAAETFQFINSNNFKISSVSVVQNGGGVKAGNWRYAVRGVTENFASSPFTDLTNLVEIYPAEESTTNNRYIIGGAGGTSTPKRVLLQVTGLEPGLYKFIELVGVNIVGPESFTVWNLKRVEITGETMLLEHTGLEPGSFIMAKEELLIENRNIKTARHIRPLDNYLIFGDITEQEEYDLTPVSTQIWHVLKRQVMPQCGFIDDLGPASEYQVVSNTYDKLGHMYGETYRWGMRGTYRGTGAKSKVAFLDDIRIDASATNRVTSANTPYGNRRGIRIKDIVYAINVPGAGDTTLGIQLDLGYNHGYIVGDTLTIAGATGLAPLVNINTTHTITAILGPIVYLQFQILGTIITGTYNAYSGHITGGLPNGALTNDTATPLVDGEVYSFYPEFSNIQWDYIFPDGKRMRDVFESFEFVRLPCIKEVLLTGILIPSDDTGGAGYHPQKQFYPVGVAIQDYTTALNDPLRRLGFFVSPDILYDFNRVAYSAGDKIVNYGTAPTQYIYETLTSPDAKYIEFNGSFSMPVTPDIADVENAINVSIGGSGTITGPVIGTVSYSLTETGGAPLDDGVWDMNMVIATPDYFQDTAGFPDPGLYNVQYFHELTDKYGSITDGLYIPTGHFFKPEANERPIINNQAVFGGDVFTQKTYLHLKYAGVAGVLGAIGISFYSQNRVNTQMRNYNAADTGMLFPSHEPDIDKWLHQLFPARDQFFYNKGYSAFNLINQFVAYNASLTTLTHFPTDIIWTLIKVLNGLVDSWRVLPPLNRVSLDRSKGDLVGMHILNGELYTRQQRDFARQYFNSRGMLQTLESESIILGSGSVMSRPGQTTSTLGSSQKWAFVEGKSQGGNDVLYWINIELGKFIRFGADGTVSIADIKGLRAFMANDIIWASGDTPAAGTGIHGAWLGRFSEVHFVFKGVKSSAEWTSGATYEAGAAVHLLDQPAGTYTTFGQTGEIYVAISGNTADADNKPESGINWLTTWEKIAHTDTRYYSEFALVYSEVKNGFVCFISPQPDIYFQRGKDIMSCLPTFFSAEAEHGQDEIFIHNKGVPCEWYKTSGYVTINPMSYTAGSLNLTASGGLLTNFPHPEVFTYTITIHGTDFYVDTVNSDTSLTLQALFDDNNVAILPDSNGTVSAYSISLAEDARIDQIVNDTPNLSKVWEYLQMNTYRIPYRVDLETSLHVSFLKQQEFDFLENYYYSPIKQDSTATPSDNNQDSSDLFGPWLKVTLKMKRFVYQNIKNFIVTCNENLPNPLRK